ncbi:MAG: phosphatidylglycerophosphatase A [Phycisphaerales bacterium]|jgi:phosphatidylglycerophosphatase A|nr:phosphatidylglycerophosphatase A [Phycisphaerales bacterium]
MRRWIVTLFGAGLLPVAPGTAGSLLTAAMLFGLYALIGRGSTVDYRLWQICLVIGLLIFSWTTVALGGWTNRFFGKKDPGSFVLDESAGICLTWLALPVFDLGRQAWVAAAVFVAFRLFDILKPWPAKKLEYLPAGWGILMDDLAAAVYANILCQIVLRWIF